jgi:REP element-mobilizing transposase RayT
MPAQSSHKSWHSRGYLPHFDHPGTIQYITFRLADSVPAEAINRWRDELDLAGNEPADDPRCTELLDRIEKYADAGMGNCWLRQPPLAKIVQNALLHFDSQRYNLIAWCVMPNHVHALIETRPGFPLGDIVHSWKSFTAKACNRILQRQAAFWMPDYFDRYIRNPNHLQAVITYIAENPVKAHLCPTPSDWPWSHAGIPPA